MEHTGDALEDPENKAYAIWQKEFSNFIGQSPVVKNVTNKYDNLADGGVGVCHKKKNHPEHPIIPQVSSSACSFAAEDMLRSCGKTLYHKDISLPAYTSNAGSGIASNHSGNVIIDKSRLMADTSSSKSNVHSLGPPVGLNILHGGMIGALNNGQLSVDSTGLSHCVYDMHSQSGLTYSHMNALCQGNDLSHEKHSLLPHNQDKKMIPHIFQDDFQLGNFRQEKSNNFVGNTYTHSGTRLQIENNLNTFNAFGKREHNFYHESSALMRAPKVRKVCPIDLTANVNILCPVGKIGPKLEQKNYVNRTPREMTPSHSGCHFFPGTDAKNVDLSFYVKTECPASNVDVKKHIKLETETSNYRIDQRDEFCDVTHVSKSEESDCPIGKGHCPESNVDSKLNVPGKDLVKQLSGTCNLDTFHNRKDNAEESSVVINNIKYDATHNEDTDILANSVKYHGANLNIDFGVQQVPHSTGNTFTEKHGKSLELITQCSKKKIPIVKNLEMDPSFDSKPVLEQSTKLIRGFPNFGSALQENSDSNRETVCPCDAEGTKFRANFSKLVSVVSPINCQSIELGKTLVPECVKDAECEEYCESSEEVTDQHSEWEEDSVDFLVKKYIMFQREVPRLALLCQSMMAKVESNPSLSQMLNCCYCNKKESCMADLDRHCLWRHGINLAKLDFYSNIPAKDLKKRNDNCQFCGLKCNHTTGRIHLAESCKMIHAKSRYQCRLCDAIIVKKPIKHLQLSHLIGKEKLKCKQCDIEMAPSVMGSHMEEVHNDKVHRCKNCPFWSSVESKVRHHEQICLHKSKRERVVTSHKLPPLHMPDLVKASKHDKLKERDLEKDTNGHFICPQCGYPFPNTVSLKRHLGYSCDKGPGGIKVKCLYCNTKISRYTYHSHMRKLHSFEINGQLCDFCDRPFSKEALAIHLETDHKKVVHKCNQCSFWSLNTRKITTHKNREHPEQTGNKQFCSKCGQSFDDRRGALDHVRLCIPMDDSNSCSKFVKVQCEVCSYICSSREAYLVHKRTHTGEKPFKCEKCGKSFAQAESLGRHMKSHEGRKDFVCSICDKAFVQKCTLDRHLLAHEGVKNYVCQICGAQYSQSYPLSKHIKKKHPEHFVPTVGGGRNISAKKIAMILSGTEFGNTHKEVV